MDLSTAARSFLGTPFKHLGRTKEGVDCAGLVILSGLACGYTFADRRTYSRFPNEAQLQETLAQSKELVMLPKHTEVLKNDIILFRFSEEPQHLGICGGDTLIHSYASAEKVIEHRFADVWKKRIVNIYRIGGSNGSD